MDFVKLSRVSFVRSIQVVLTLILIAAVLSPAPANAAVVSFACPTGGGTYQVDNGAVTGTTGTCTGDLTLDSSVTSLNQYAFAYNRLTSLTIPATVTTITGSTFGGAGGTSLVSITVDPANPNYSSVDGVLFNKSQTELLVYPANKTGSTYTIPSSVTTFRNYGFSGNKFLTSLDIPNTVTTIGGQVFYNSKAFTTFNVGTGVTSIGVQVFSSIQTLTSINVDAANTTYASISGVLYNKVISILMAYPIGKTDTSFTAPNTVRTTEYSVFADARNLLTVDLSPVTTLTGQEFMGSTSVREVIFGNGLTELKSQVFQSASGLKKVTFGTGITSIVNGAFYNNTALYCVIYTGSNSTIQNYAYPNSVVPVASSASCLADPAFTLSSNNISVTKDSAVSSYSITSTGGTIASYSISPAITNTPGLTFSTVTGLISGTPTTVAASRIYTVTARNAANTATQTFSITVLAPYVAPTPVPLLKTVTAPQIHLKDNKLICAAGLYQTGQSLAGQVQTNTLVAFTPASYTFNLLVNGVAQTALAQSTSINLAAWSISQLPSNSLLSCTVTVAVNTLINSDKSTDNLTGVAAAQAEQTQAISTASAAYSAALTENSKAYQKALVDNRAQWRKEITAVRANYFETLTRINSISDSRKMISDKSTALRVMIAAQKKSAADYKASQPAALAAREEANKAALAARDAAIAKANAAFGTFIESIGYGVLVP